MTKRISIIITFIVIFSSCNDKKNMINTKEFYYSLKDEESVYLSLDYDTLITDKGVFPIKDILDEEKPNMYHLSFQDITIGLLIQNPIDDKDSMIDIDIDSTYIRTKKDFFTLHKMNNKNYSQLLLSKKKLDFLKKHKIIH